MADFELVVPAGAVVADWVDPATSSKPSRLNLVGIPALYYRCGAATVEVDATIAGSVPLDAALGGDLFSWFFAEHPGIIPPIINPVGQSAIARFLLPIVGGYLLVAMRPGHGRVIIHLRRE